MHETKKQFVGWVSGASVLLFYCWLLFIRSTLGVFQNTHGFDPLAMINVLFPSFWFILLGYVSLGLLTIYFRLDRKFLHLLLLCGFALILYMTPFLLSGFSWSPDSLFHGGIAAYMPEILGGESLPLSGYATSYPLSFIATFLVEAGTGLTIFQYSLYVYPVISIIAFTLLAYSFISRLLGSSKAFVSMLIALPALHFFEPHVSPFSFGTLLILASLITLTSGSQKMRILFFFSILAMVLTHPVSPISLGIFLVSALLIRFIGRPFTGRSEQDSNLVSNISWRLMFVLGIVWVLWTLNWATTHYASVNYAISKIVSLEFLQDIRLIAEFTGSGFIYNDIQLLSLFIYAIFAIFDLTVFLFNVRKLRSDTQDSHVILQLFFSFSSILFAVFGYLLFLGTGEHVLLGRGLLFFILNSAIAFTIQHYQNTPTNFQKVKLFLIFTLILFLCITFPLNSYSKEAYNTHTPTSGAGLHFIGTNLDLSTQSISMAADRQLASYIDLNNGLILSSYPPNLTQVAPSYIALRINSYFLISMRYDFNFENNSFVQLRNTLEANPTYNKIYTNSLFDIFAHNVKE
ncbi:MAG: hypothetical protein ACFFCW_32580 [Candidatus Hodarchaeota archaeon]